MKKNILLLALVLVIPKIAFAGGMNDDPLLTMLLINIVPHFNKHVLSFIGFNIWRFIKKIIII